MLVGLVVAPEVACEACEASFAVARFADALPCPACGEAAAVGVACLAGELGDEALLRPPFDDPCCPWCDAAFALADVDVQLARGAIACPGCGVALPVRPAPAPLPASGIAYLIGEDLGGGAEAQPTIFRCPGCGGELEAAAGSRTRCAYCTAEVHLPRRARGGDRAHGWIVAFDPASLGPALAAAGDATTATDALTALAWHVVATVRRQVAANPATLDVALARLAADADDGVRAAVVANPATAVATLVELARTDGGAAAASARLPAAVIDELAASPQAWVRGAVAANPAAPGACLSRLAADATPEVRAAVAANPAAPAAALTALAADGATRTRGAVAANPAAPAAALAALAAARDDELDDTSVHALIAARADAPPEVLAGLAASRLAAVRRAVARHRATTPAALKRLAKDRDGQVAFEATLNPACPSWWRRLW